MIVYEIAYEDEKKSRYSTKLPYSPRIGEHFELTWFDDTKMSGSVVAIDWIVDYDEEYQDENNQYITIFVILQRDKENVAGGEEEK